MNTGWKAATAARRPHQKARLKKKPPSFKSPRKRLQSVKDSASALRLKNLLKSPTPTGDDPPGTQTDPGTEQTPGKDPRQGFDTFQKPGNGSTAILREKKPRVEDRYQATRLN